MEARGSQNSLASQSSQSVSPGVSVRACQKTRDESQSKQTLHAAFSPPHVCTHVDMHPPHTHTGAYTEMHYRQRHNNKKLCGICALSSDSLTQYGNCHSLQKSYSVRNREIYSFSQCQNLLIIITSVGMVVS